MLLVHGTCIGPHAQEVGAQQDGQYRLEMQVSQIKGKGVFAVSNYGQSLEGQLQHIDI